MSSPKLVQVGLVVLLLSLVVAPAWAQRSASLTGIVADGSGAVIPGASVQLVNVDNGEQFFAETNENGSYTFPLLPPGIFSLTVEQPGFKGYSRPNLQMETGIIARADVELEVGVVTEVITVEAEIPQLQTEQSAVGAVVRRETIENMPLINRRAAQLARLNGFVVQRGRGSNFTMAGGRGNNAMWTLDGGIVQNLTLGVSTLTFDPPVEALQEFNVNISNYSADMGRTGGGMVRMTTRSGSNEFHGSVYNYLRNDALDARNFFSRTKPKLRRNQYGASFGGPIIKDRTHFFMNYEGTKQRSENTRFANVPNPIELTGDLSSRNRTIRDPLGGEFANGIVPATRFDRIGTQIANLFPTPNVANRASRSNNYTLNQPLTNDGHVGVLRVDHVFGENNRMFFRFLGSGNVQEDAPFYPTAGIDPFNFFRDNQYLNWAPTWFHNFSPTFIMETRFTWVQRKHINTSGGADLGFPAKLGLTGTNERFFPRINLQGLTPFGRGNHERIQTPIRTDLFTQAFTHIKGQHTIKYGYEFRTAANKDKFNGRAGGAFSFNTQATNDIVASLLLGHVVTGDLLESFFIKSRANAYAAYLQDDWKVTSKLTLNLGLRWDMDQPRWEEFDNRQNSFRREPINPVSGVPGVVAFSGRNGLSRYAHGFDKNNIYPRVGIAYRLNDKTVIRAGGSVVSSGAYDQATPVTANLGFSTQGTFTSPDNGVTSAFQFQDGFPVINVPTEADLNDSFGAVPLGARTITNPEFFEYSDRRNPYMTTFNFNIQRQLPNNMLVEVGYLSTLGKKLAAPGSRHINQTPPWIVDDLLARGIRPNQSHRPFPQFSNVRVVSAAIGNSNYHGVNFKLEKRYSHGLHFSANYTWSKLIDDVESRGELGGNAGNNAWQNFYDRSTDRGLGGNHIGRRFIWSSVYELPFGKSSPTAIKQVIGGWSVGLITELRDGSPFGVIENNAARCRCFAPTLRSDITGSASLNPRWRDNVLGEPYFLGNFTQPAEGQFGNAGRNVAIGPGAISADLSILKDFNFDEQKRLQFRVEMLNFINRANFQLPEQRRNNGNFGNVRANGFGLGARIIQLGLHFKF